MGTPLGVSYFFLSSGFVLTYAQSRAAELGTFDVRRFWLKRAARILPVYYLGLLVALPLLIAGRDVTTGKTLATVLLIQAWSPATALYWNYPAWALSALAFFYVVFPALLLSTRALSQRSIAVLAALAWGATIAPGLLYAITSPDHLAVVAPSSHALWIDVLRYNPLVRLPEFVLGVLAARLYLKVGGLSRRRTVIFCAGLLALGAGLAVAQLLPYAVINNGFLDPVLILLLVALASGGWLSRVLSHPRLVFLGQSSYCLYMVHAPIIFLAHAVWPQYRHSPAFVAALVLATIAVALVLYRFVERPVTTALSARLTRGPARVGAPQPA
jgi:peptidoglycan/LPS O-acetylase OafA/YrhL